MVIINALFLSYGDGFNGDNDYIRLLFFYRLKRMRTAISTSGYTVISAEPLPWQGYRPGRP